MATPILFVNHASAMGGAEIALLRLLRFLSASNAPSKWELHLACALNAQSPWPKQTESLPIQLHNISLPRLLGSPLAPLQWQKGADQLASLAQRVNARVLFSNAMRSSFYTARAARQIQRPFIWQMNETWVAGKQPNIRFLDRLAKRYLSKRAYRTIAVSEFVAQHLPKSEKNIVIHNAVESQPTATPLDTMRRDFRTSFGIPSSAPFICCVNRLAPTKGQDRFLRMMASVKREIPEAWFGVVGGSIFRPGDRFLQELKALAKELKLDGCTVFTGQLPNPAPAFKALDIFVYPGDPEAFGLVNIEAMAYGKPIVSFAHGAQQEIIINHKTGLTTPPLDTSALSAAVVRLLRDPKEAQRMGEAGRARVKKHFTAHVQFPRIEAILTSAAAK